MKHIMMNADVLCTTAHTSRDDEYYVYSRDVANVNVADETRAMTMAQLVLGWPTFRPLLMGGDEWHLVLLEERLHHRPKM